MPAAPRSVLLLVLFVLAHAVQAAGLTPQERAVLQGDDLKTAQELARKFGRETNYDGFRELIKANRPELLMYAVDSLPDTKEPLLSKEAEALIVEHFENPKARTQLLRMIGQRFDYSGKSTLSSLLGPPGYPNYQNRRLFDLLYTAIKYTGDGQRTYVTKLTRTNLPGIEPELLALMPLVDRDSASLLALALGERHYSKAIPELRKIYSHSPHDATRALLLIGTPQARQVIIEKLSELTRTQSGNKNSSEIRTILETLSRQPAEFLPDLKTLLSVLPKELEEPNKHKLGDIVKTLCIPAAGINTTEQAHRSVHCIIEALAKKSFKLTPVLTALKEVPPTIDIDFPKFRNATLSKMEFHEMNAYCELVGRREEKLGVEDLFHHMAQEMTRDDKYHFSVAVGAILEFPSPEIWQRARDRLEQINATSKIPEALYRNSLSRLDNSLRNPQFAVQQLTSNKANRLLQAAQRAIPKPASLDDQTKKTDPERYIRETLAYTAALNNLAKQNADAPGARGLRQTVVESYHKLGDYQRLDLRRPRDAITTYNLMGAFPEKVSEMHSAIAETYELNLNDRTNALLHYEKALEAARSTPRAYNDLEAAMNNWNQRVLREEVAYLKTGKTFRGKLGREDSGILMSVLFFLNNAGQKPPGMEQPLTLDSSDPVTRSRLNLIRLAGTDITERDEPAVLKFVRDNDPAGFMTACLFAGLEEMAKMEVRQSEAIAKARQEMLERMPKTSQPSAESKAAPAADGNMRAVMRAGKKSAATAPMGTFTNSVPHFSPALRNIARRWLAANHIEAWSPDKRLSSPTQTWNLFIESLKTNDPETAKSCLTPGMRARLQDLFKPENAGQLKLMAESFSGFTLQNTAGNAREAVVARKLTNGAQQAGFVYFVELGGEWVINEM